MKKEMVTEQATSLKKNEPHIMATLVAHEKNYFCADYEDFIKSKRLARKSLIRSPQHFEFELRCAEQKDYELFVALKIDEPKLKLWFEKVASMNDREMATVYYLVAECGLDLECALDKMDDINLFEGDMSDAVRELIDEVYSHEIPDFLHGRLDYPALANDMQHEGSIWEFRFGGQTYTCTNADEI